MTRARTTVALSLLAAVLPGTPAAAEPPLLDAHGCESTLHVLADSTARLQPQFVPQHYELLTWAPGVPYVALWSFACDGVSVRGGLPRPTQVSVAAVAIQHPDRPADEQPPLELPNTWAHYVFGFSTNNRVLADAIRGSGLPAEQVTDMAFDTDLVLTQTPDPVLPIRETNVHIAHAWNSWTRPPVQHEPTHSHANQFWFDGPRGTAILDLTIPHARDHFCELEVAEQCGTVDAAPGSQTELFLERSHASAAAAVAHAKIERVRADARRR